MMIEFTYKNGRGHVKLDLSAVLPCSAADMKRVLSFVNLSDDPAERAEIIYKYISGRVDDLKEERGQYNENTETGKKEITKVNAVMKKYISNAAALAKEYGFQELTDKAAQIKMHAGTVYAVIFNSNTCPDKCKTTVEPFDGWTFEKSGFMFDVRRETYGRKSSYIIMLHETGLKVAESTNKNAAPAEITPWILEALTKAPDKINEAKANFKKLMIAAGYMDPEPAAPAVEPASAPVQDETPEPAETEGKETMSEYAFTETTLTCKGKTFPAEYNIIEDGSVLAFVILGTNSNGRKEKQRIRFTPDNPDYSAALAAASTGAKYDGRRETILTGCRKKPAEAIKPEPAAPAAETVQDKTPEPAPDQKPTRGTVPEKSFIGQIIQGAGWKIYFDPDAERTRVIFDNVPPKAVRETVKAAGFYYSGIMKSWNKKLTFKAYRAAKELSGQLEKMYAA